jgi:hypothetical protein
LRNWGFIPGSSTNHSHDVPQSDFQIPLHFTTLYVATFAYTSSSLLLLVYSQLLVCYVFIITMNTQHIISWLSTNVSKEDERVSTEMHLL